MTTITLQAHDKTNNCQAELTITIKDGRWLVQPGNTFSDQLLVGPIKIIAIAEIQKIK